MLKMKKFLIVLTIILLVNPISFTQITLAEGALVDKSFIEIETSDELAKIKDDLTENYILTNDIDLKDTEWEPIDEGVFTGTLIGNEFKIKNMPAEYLEDENLGLFTEVSDVKNIDVDIEFEEAPQTDEKVLEEELEALQTEKEVLEEEPEAPQSEQEVIEEESEKPQAEEEVVEKEKKSSREINVQNAFNYNEFKKHLENPNVSVINLTGDIDVSSALGNRIEVAPRDLIIEGGKKADGTRYNIKQNGNSSRSYSMMKFKNTKNATVTFRNVNMISESGNSLLTETGGSGEWKAVFENVNKEMDVENEVKSYDGRLVNAKNVHVVFKETVNFITETESIISEAKSVTVNKNASVSLKTKGIVYDTSQVGAKLHIRSGGNLFVFGNGTTAKSVVIFTGNNSEVLVEGRFMIGSDRKVIGRNVGLIKIVGNDSKFNVKDGATVGFSHNQGSILHMKSQNGEVNISGEGTKVEFLVQEGNGDYDAPIHFEDGDNYKLNVSDHALFKVKKEAGQAAGIIFGTGSGHKVTTTSGGKFHIHNKGSGVAVDPSGPKARNQALHFNGTVPEFNLTGKGSEVSLVADSGVAMHMTDGGVIKANEGTIFVARGKTKRDDRGVIDTGGVEDKAQTQILLTNPAFYDFRNENTKGMVFHVGFKAEIIGNRIDLAGWQRGENIDLNGPSAFHYSNIVQYKYIQADFTSLIASTSTELTALHSKGGAYPNGLKEFARVSGNVAEAVVDDLYQPTDADQEIYAHVSVDEGIFGQRDILTDEAEVDIELTKKSDGTIQTLKGKTIGQDQYPEQDAYEIYGKPVDSKKGAFGWAKIKLPNNAYLEAGDTLKVVGARIKAANHTERESEADNLFSETKTVIDVTPPTPTEIDNVELTEYSKSLEGTLTEEDAVVSVEVNREDDNGEIVYDRENNTFTYTFTNPLNVDDKVQVFFSDTSGPAEGLGDEADRPDRPETNTDFGNKNPRDSIIYHDKIFYQAPVITVTKEPGELKFDSVPDNLHFDVKVKPYKECYFVDKEKLGQPLVIIDDRPAETKKGWKLKAKMEGSLTAIDDSKKILGASLIYRDGSIDKTLTDDGYEVVKSHVHEEEDTTERWDLSSAWKEDGDGIFIDIEPGALKADYQGQVNWILEDAP